MDLVDEFLEHYGTRGMKWGVRKKSSPRPSFMPPVKSSLGKPKWQSAPDKKPTSEVTAPGKSRFGRPPPKKKLLSEDAAQFRELRIKVQKKGIQSLTNKDIEIINKRADLMSKYNKANPKKKSPLRKAAEIAVDQALEDFGSKKIVEFLAGPRPRPLKKDKQAETLTQILSTARQIRKATKPTQDKN